MATRFVLPTADVGGGISPSDGAKLFFFDTGTNDLRDTFTTSGASVANINPVIADSKGVFPDIFIAGSYKVKLTDKNDVKTGFGEKDPVTEFDQDLGIDNVTALRALDGTDFVNSESFVHLLGHTTIGDQGNGVFFFNGIGNPSEDDNGYTIIGTDNTRWSRLGKNVISVADFGADLTGSIDATAAIQAAIDFFPTGDGTIFLPTGRYLVTSTITIAQNGIHLIGQGKRSTFITFAPTANDTCILIDKSPSIISYGSVENMTLFSSDSTFEKIGVDCVTIDNWYFSNFMVDGAVGVGGSSIWSGGAGGSIGIRTNGHQVCSFLNINIFADRPIVFSRNPNVFLDVDHFNFHNSFFIAGLFPVVECDPTLRQITNLTFTGFQAWVAGTDGFLWNDTVSTGVSQTIVFNNVRWENGSDTTKHCINIFHLNGLQELAIVNCQGGFERNGYKLRGVNTVRIINNINTGNIPARVQLDIDAGVRSTVFESCLWQSGATAIITGQQTVFRSSGAGTGFSSPELPSTGEFESTLAELHTITDYANSGYRLTLVNDADAELSTDNMLGAKLTVITNDSKYADFGIRGSSNTTVKTVETGSDFSSIKDNAGTTNVYFDVDRYRIQNKTGFNRAYLIIVDGRYVNFNP